jgi:NAD(P)-dependent dehydrogenase (short-subunit alcohol dehydrogenase family)
MMAIVQDKVAIVSGVGPGMGRDIAIALAREGAHIVLAARSLDKLEAVASELASLDRRVLCVPTDVTKSADCERLVVQAVQTFGRIDILSNNAFDPGARELVEDADLDGWRAMFEVNFFGAMQLSQQVIPTMKKQGSGSIVMTNSMSMRLIIERYGGYAASKAALLAATQTMARELGQFNIRVNSVVPGYIWGERLERYFHRIANERGVSFDEVYREIAAQTSLRHLPHSEEIAPAVVFFASEWARAITGQTLDVNGGHVFV